MKSSTMNSLLRILPQTKQTAKIISKIRIKRIATYFIPQEDIMLGEKSYEEKQHIVEKYLSKHWKGIEKTEQKAEYILTHASQYKQHQDIDKIKVDMLFKRLAYGFEPEEYLCFGLEGLKPQEVENWVSDLDRYIYIFSMNNLQKSQIFNNKFQTYEMFREYYKRDAVHVKTKSDYIEFERFFNSHSEFVKKPVFEGMGHGIELVKTSSTTARSCFDNLISLGEHIVEERIQQSDVLSKLNASSVNTIRCITLNTYKGIIVPYTFLKVGRDGSFVDNGGAGGILAGIDENTGIITTHGYDELNTEYIVHPNSGVTFKGYRFPEWGEMKKMCCEMAKMIPDVKCIGWDLALTDKGWIVVEGNGMTQLIVPQIVFKRGIKREVKGLMAQMDLVVS